MAGYVVFDARAAQPTPKILAFARAAAAAIRAGGETPIALCVGRADETFARAIGGGYAEVVRCAIAAADFAGAAGAALAAYFAERAKGEFRVYVARAGAGRDIAAALAGACGGGILTDVHAVGADGVATARKLGGSAIVTVEARGGPAIFVCDELAPPTDEPSAQEPTTSTFAAPAFAADIAVEASSPLERGEVLLDDADIIVSGGKGLGGAAPFTGMLAELAGELGAALGATRAAVDAGWVAHAMQIGQTGRTVAPRLYLAVGVSGQIQHRVGMQSADTIIAINADPNAPIATFSDLYVVGDAFAIVPALTRQLREEKGNS